MGTGCILFVCSIVFGFLYVGLDDWSCRSGFIAFACISAPMSFLIMLSASTASQMYTTLTIAILLVVLLLRIYVIYRVNAQKQKLPYSIWYNITIVVFLCILVPNALTAFIIQLPNIEEINELSPSCTVYGSLNPNITLII